MIPIGLVIWACEGTKRCHFIEVVNEEKGILDLFLEYLFSLGIDKSRLRARVQCGIDRIKEETLRWSKEMNIPLSQFQKPISKIHKGKRNRSSSSLILRYYSRPLKRQIEKQARELGLIS